MREAGMLKRPQPALMVLALLGVVGLGSWWLQRQALRLPQAPLAATPADTTALLWLNLPVVRRSTLWARLVEARGGTAGLREVERLCGIDPLDGVGGVTVFASSEDGHPLGRTGVIARGELDVEGLGDCARASIAQEGGSLRAVELEGLPALAGRGDSRAAFIGTDAFIAGDREVVRGIIRTIREEEPSGAADPVLSQLWEDVARGQHAALVAHVPVEWRRALRAHLTSLADPDLQVLAGVRALGIGARVERGLTMHLVLAMRDEPMAMDARDAIESYREGLPGGAAALLNPFAPILRRARVVVDDHRVVLEVHLSAGQLEEVLGALNVLLNAGAPQRPQRPTPGTPALRPDETMRQIPPPRKVTQPSR